MRKYLTYPNLSLSVIGLIILPWAVAWVIRIAQVLPLPQTEYSEGFMLYTAQLFGTGEWSWELPADPPYMVSNYSPLAYYFFGALTHWFGVTSFTAGRILVLVTTVLCLVMVYLISYQVTKRKLLSIVVSLLPLTQPLVLNWSVIIRVDMLAVLFELVGIYCALCSERRGWPWLITSAVFFLAAVFTKQPAIAGAAAAILYVNSQCRWKYSTLLVIPGLLILLVVSLFTDWGFFRQLFVYQRTFPTFKSLGEIASLILVSYTPLIPLLLLAVITVAKDWRSNLSLFTLTAVILDVIMIGRLGGNTNYQLEAVFAITLVAVPALRDLVEDRRLAPLLAVFLIPIIVLATNADEKPEATPEYLLDYQTVKALIADADYPILTENAGVVLEAGKVPYYEPFVFTQLSRAGKWNEGRLLEDLESHRIDYVIAEFPLPYYGSYRYSPSVQEAIVANYSLVFNHSDPASNYNLVVYKPNKS